MDVSFAHTGGIIAIVESPDSLRVTESPILKPCDDLMRDDFNLERDSKQQTHQIKKIKRCGRLSEKLSNSWLEERAFVNLTENCEAN